MKITREAAQKKQSALSNDFVYDIQFAVCWGENQAYRDIKTDEKHFYRFTIQYNEGIKMVEGDYCTWKQPSGMFYINLNVSYWKIQDSGCAVSQGLGKNVKLTAENFKRKNFSEIAKITKELSTEKLMEYTEEFYSPEPFEKVG